MKFLGVIFILFTIVLSSGPQDDRRFTIWNKNEVAIEPWKNITIEVAEKIHYTPKSNTLDLKYGELFVGHEPKNWLEYGVGLRFSYSNLRNDNWLNENRSMVYVSLSKVLKAFELSFTNRMEYRAYKELDDYFRHKQSFKIDFPNITEWGMRFYVSEESYYKMNGAGTHKARFYTGLTALEKERFEMKLYYSLEKTKALNSWFTADIIGLNFSFDI